MLNIAVFLKTDFVRAFCRDSKAYFFYKKSRAFIKIAHFIIYIKSVSHSMGTLLKLPMNIPGGTKKSQLFVFFNSFLILI